MSPPLGKDALARKSHSVGALLIIRNRLILRLSISFSLTSSFRSLPLFLFPRTEKVILLHSESKASRLCQAWIKPFTPSCPLLAHPPTGSLPQLAKGLGKQSSLPALA